LSSKNSKSVVGLIWGFLYARRDNAESGGTLAEQKEAERRNYAERSGTEEKQKKEGNGGTMPREGGRRKNRGAEAMNGGDLWHSVK
jgi:hypothetical protein